MTAPRKRLAGATAIVLAILLVAGAAVLVRQQFFGPRAISAYFPTATAIYPGDEVRVSGVKVGTIEAIEPEGTQTRIVMSIDRGVPVPADAKAVIVAPNLIAARYVQLTPSYRDSGPTMSDDAVIPADRTAVPVEWDEVKDQLTRLATELGPSGDVSGTSVSRFIDSAANAMDGNGEKLRQTLAQLSGVARILAEGSGNIVATIQNLQIFVTALRDSNRQIVLFQNRLATLTSVVNGSRSDLDAALTDLTVAVDEVTRFVRGSRNQTAEQLTRLNNVMQNLVDNRESLENLLHIFPNAIANTQYQYNPKTGSAVGSLAFNNFSNPVWFICGMIGGVANVTAPETAKLCEQYLGPALRLLNFNSLPFPINPFLAPSAGPQNIIYTDSSLAPGGTGWIDPPEAPPDVSAYTGFNEDSAPRMPVPPPAVAPNTNAPPPGVNPGPLPAQYPGAPPPAPVQIEPPTVNDMLMPAEASAAVAPPPGNSLNGQPIPPPPPGPLLPAEGTPPA